MKNKKQNQKSKFLTMALAVVLLMLSLPAAAQSLKVRGSVSDEKGEPLIGAVVVAKKQVQGDALATATADEKGQFVIECDRKDVLVAYFLGYDDASVPVNSRSVIDIVMQPSSATVLDEVVVVGYGNERKSDLTGSVANVNMGDIRSAAVNSIDQALQGRIAGADIMSTSGDPDATTSIRIRGTRSITASNDPLIVVDGVMDAVSDLNDINPV